MSWVMLRFFFKLCPWRRMLCSSACPKTTTPMVFHMYSTSAGCCDWKKSSAFFSRGVRPKTTLRKITSEGPMSWLQRLTKRYFPLRSVVYRQRHGYPSGPSPPLAHSAAKLTPSSTAHTPLPSEVLNPLVTTETFKMILTMTSKKTKRY